MNSCSFQTSNQDYSRLRGSLLITGDAEPPGTGIQEYYRTQKGASTSVSQSSFHPFCFIPSDFSEPRIIRQIRSDYSHNFHIILRLIPHNVKSFIQIFYKQSVRNQIGWPDFFLCQTFPYVIPVVLRFM